MRTRWALVSSLLVAALLGAPSFRGAAAQDKAPAKKGGATKQTEFAQMCGLRWLKNHQSADGRWDSDGFDAACELNRCDGRGAADGDVGATALALLAFLASGETQKKGPYREAVANGLKHLCSVQADDGCIGPRSAAGFLRQHVIASLALTEAYGMTTDAKVKAPAERAIAFALTSRKSPESRRLPDGELDAQTAGWMVLLLKSGLMSELPVEKTALADTLADLEKLTDAATGRVAVKAPRDAEATAVAVLGKLFDGRTPAADATIELGADVVAKSPPVWTADGAGVDFAAWHFGSLAIFQLGRERWHKWDAAMKTALVDHQRMEAGRDERGSWDPVGAGARDLGRVGATALACLDLEVYYRYGRVLTPPKPAPPADGK